MFERPLLAIYRSFKALGLAGAFASMFIENVGVPLPTEIGYVIACDLIGKNPHSYPFVLFFLTLGHLAGSLVSWRIGGLGDTLVSRRFAKSQRAVQTQEKLQTWYARHGTLTVFLCRFVGYVRPWSSFVAGFAKVPFWPFVLWTFLGSLIFNVFALYLSGIFILVWRRYSEYHFPIAILVFLTFFALIIRELITGAKHKKQTPPPQ